MRWSIVFALVCFTHGPERAMATEWFGVHLPCITLFTVTFHWMTLLIFSLLCCCCCSPCCIAAAAFGLQGKGGSKGGQHIDLAWIPPTPDEEKEGLMNGYGDVFPAELRRMPYKKEQKPKSSINMVPYLFCCLIFFFVLCLLIIPFAAWSSYQLYNQIMEELFEPSPLWMWVSILIISTMAGCIGFPSFFLRSEGAPKKVTIYCPACLGCIVFILCMWGFGTAPASKPYLARAGNEICQNFTDNRPAICGGVAALQSPAPVLGATSMPIPVDTSAPIPFGATTPTAGRLLFGAEHRVSSDIDLDEDGHTDTFLAGALRRLDPSHDAATSYLQNLLAGGSYCVETSGNRSGWTAPTYNMKAHNAAVSFSSSTLTDSAGCDSTTELCQNGFPAPNFMEATSCTCNGKHVLGTKGEQIGGHCNLWNFGDPAAWCLVNSGAVNCGTLETYKGATMSVGPCQSGLFDQLVVMRSKATAVGFIQYISVLIVGTLLAIISCCMACVAYADNKAPKQRRYHEDNSLPWIDLVIIKPNNAICWQVLGWSQVSWDADDPKLYPSSEAKKWNSLTSTPSGKYQCSEMQAAAFLGFTQHSWDSLDQEEDRLLAERGGEQDELVDAQLADQFYAWNEEASKRITAATPEIKRLEVYGFYHQARQGNVSGLRPSENDPEEQNKYDAWYRLLGMTRSTAMREYINAAKELPPAPGVPENPSWGRPQG